MSTDTSRTDPAQQETAEADSPTASGISKSPPHWWALLQLAALAFHMPLALLTGSQRALASTSEALLTGTLVFGVSALVYYLLRRPLGAWRSLETVSVGLLVFWHWGSLSQSGVVGGIPIVSIGLGVLLIAAASRFASNPRFRRVAFVVSVTLAATMLVMLGFESANTPDPVVQPSITPSLGPVETTPDVLFVVVDSYARSDVLDEIYGFDNSPFTTELTGSGFHVPSSASANHTGTHASVPSMLDLEILVQPGTSLSNSDLDLLSEVMGGDNNTVSLLKDAGYTYVHGDTQSWINRCGNQVDVCLPGPPIKGTMYRLLADTPVGPLLYPVSGEPETHLNVERIEQLRNWGEISSSWPSPVFAFLHLELPHPPLFLDSSCEVRLDPDLGGPTMTWGVETPDQLEDRRNAYVEQIECANSVIADFLGQLDGSEIVIITADHGPDSEGTLDADIASWTDRQLWERLSVMTALRFPEGCEAPADDEFELVNTLRLTLSCVYEEDLQSLPGSYQASTYEGAVIPLKDPDSFAETTGS